MKVVAAPRAEGASDNDDVVAAPRAEGASDNDNIAGPLSVAETVRLARELKEQAK